MARGDYTNTTTIARYKQLVEKPSSTPSRVTVSATERRTRAELLDMVEELFQNKTYTGDTPDQENIRALLHILIKSLPNALDDGVFTFAENTTYAFGDLTLTGSGSKSDPFVYQMTLVATRVFGGQKTIKSTTLTFT